MLDRHHGNLQNEAAEWERAAVRLRNFQPTIVAGLLQTIPYTQALLPLTDLTEQIDYDATLAGRLERQQVLYQPGRVFEFLIAEPVLSWSPGDAVMLGQRDRITQLAQLPTVRIAVLPHTAAVATPWHGFNLYDYADGSASVFLELIHQAEKVTKAEHITLYQRLWDRLWAASTTGNDAVALIRRIDQAREV